MPKMIFLNLPVKDLAAAERFYSAIGCTKNEQFSDENAISMMWSDEIVFMLLTHDFFRTFYAKPQIADPRAAIGALICLSRDSREEVDAITKIAGASGGEADIRDPMDYGWMYNRAFTDPDGHIFEVVFMDPTAMAQAGEAAA